MLHLYLRWRGGGSWLRTIIVIWGVGSGVGSVGFAVGSACVVAPPTPVSVDNDNEEEDEDEDGGVVVVVVVVVSMWSCAIQSLI